MGLWETYKATGDPAIRGELIVQYAPLVRYVASRLSSGLPAHVELDDLVSYGTFGLIDAIEKFDLAKGVKFETYASSRIRGAIIDELRSADWVPRSVRTKARDVERAIARFEGREGRAPSEAELAAEMRLSAEELREMLSHAASPILVPLANEGIQWGPTLTDNPESGRPRADTLADTGTLDPEAALEDAELRSLVAGAVARTEDRERVVLALYYFEGLTLGQIGDVLGVTESRVCQLHTRAVMSLRANLSA